MGIWSRHIPWLLSLWGSFVVILFVTSWGPLAVLLSENYVLLVLGLLHFLVDYHKFLHSATDVEFAIMSDCVCAGICLGHFHFEGSLIRAMAHMVFATVLGVKTSKWSQILKVENNPGGVHFLAFVCSFIGFMVYIIPPFITEIVVCSFIAGVATVWFSFPFHCMKITESPIHGLKFLLCLLELKFPNTVLLSWKSVSFFPFGLYWASAAIVRSSFLKTPIKIF